MKRFLLFKGLDYHPLGGMKDFVADFHLLEEAKQSIKSELKETYEREKDFGIWDNLDEVEYDFWSYNWVHIYDSENMKIVWEGLKRK